MSCKLRLWDIETEIYFFEEALKNFASPETIFYSLDNKYYAYVPKNITGKGAALNSRNTLIGQYTEKWAKDLLEPIASKLGLYAVNHVKCEDIGLSNRSSADVAFCLTNEKEQSSENIKIIFEVKMSIISNYVYSASSGIEFIGDYKTHKGNPSLLRSDSMLKAIGKSINVRVSGAKSKRIPIVVLGNSPITEEYKHKVDILKRAGVIQGFWSVNPNPTESNCIYGTEGKGFRTISDINSLEILCNELLAYEMNYFSSMISKPELGKIISIANLETDDIKKAEKFLELLNNP
jgi:hypothetical protein